jgi:preprotein translocase subunit SecB
MSPAPLQLERHFFSKILVEAHGDAEGVSAHRLNCSVEVERATDNARRFQVILNLKLERQPDQKTTYTGEVQAVGFFRVVDDYGDEAKTLSLVETNGATLLYGAIRELLINLSARGPWAAISLPTVTFLRPVELSTVRARQKRKKIPRD